MFITMRIIYGCLELGEAIQGCLEPGDADQGC